MFREIDLSRAVPSNTVAITLRYQVKGGVDGASVVARIADNARGDHAIPLSGGSGEITVRLSTAQRLFYRLEDPGLHLNLWVIHYRVLERHSC